MQTPSDEQERATILFIFTLYFQWNLAESNPNISEHSLDIWYVLEPGPTLAGNQQVLLGTGCASFNCDKS